MVKRRCILLAAPFCVAAAALQPGKLAAQTVPSPEIQQHIDRVTACLTTPVMVKDDPQPCPSLADRMAAAQVPGVGIAVIHKGAIEWAQGFGVVRLGGEQVTEETLFQAGSISKPVAAMAALHLVEQGKLSLDADIGPSLTSWKIPPSDKAPAAMVTLRELLSHTAGFNVHGFSGYAADAPVPTLVQILNGEKPANSDPIRLVTVPGSQWQYSGGGYTVMQQLLLDVANQPFPQLLHDAVLAPIGMGRSTYEQPLPAALRSGAAVPYEADGTPVEGGFHTYPEMAAAGLWTTPSDLARFAIEIQRSLSGEGNHVLSPDMTKQMLAAGQNNWGLGLTIGGSPDSPYFMHGGVNEGFESLLVGYERSGDGAVVMTNAQGGMNLAEAVMRSIAATYNWPDFHSVVRTSVEIDAATLASYIGVYALSPSFAIAVTLEQGQLMAQATGQGKFRLFPESPTKFFLEPVDAQLEFVTGADGGISSLILHLNGQDSRAERQK
jgi:CubicO group peptidase (beta-lactamase class C family)